LTFNIFGVNPVDFNKAKLMDSKLCNIICRIKLDDSGQKSQRIHM
ncbi:hypothetical protein Csa_023755, partial [Cucumis sativus]